MASFRELKIWNSGIDFCNEIYSLTKQFPKEELFSLTNQLRRASSSVPANIAEGWSRNSDKSFRHYLDISKGSLSEIITFLIIAEKQKYISAEASKVLQVKADDLSKMIYKLQLRLASNINAEKITSEK